MNPKHLSIIAIIATALSQPAFAQQAPVAENTDTAAAQLESKLDTEFSAPAEDPLLQQYKVIKEKNFKAVEFEKEETYFEYQENPDTGEFVIVLVKDSYVKAERGDICQVGTQVHLRTSIQSEFTQKLVN